MLGRDSAPHKNACSLSNFNSFYWKRHFLKPSSGKSDCHVTSQLKSFPNCALDLQKSPF